MPRFIVCSILCRYSWQYNAALLRRHSTAKPNSKPSRTFTIYMVVWSSNNITSTITAKNTNYYAIVKNDVFVAKMCKYALYESSEGLFCAHRKPANPCHPEVNPAYTSSKGRRKKNCAFCTRRLPQGGRGWLAFGERKIIPQSFRRVRICKFSRKKRRFLQLRKYW